MTAENPFEPEPSRPASTDVCQEPCPDACGEPESLLKDALQGLGEACLLIGDSGVIIFSNCSAKKLLMPRGRLTGVRLSAVVEDCRLVRLTDRCLQTGRRQHGSCFIQFTKEETANHHSFQAAAVLLTTASGRRLVRLSIQEKSEMDEALLRGAEITGGVLIQLRTRLCVIQGYLENLRDGLISSPVLLRRALLVMCGSVLHINRIISMLERDAGSRAALTADQPDGDSNPSG